MEDLQSLNSVFPQGTPQYGRSRQQYFNKDETDRFPSEIHNVTSSEGVVAALRRARALGVSVGVRSGGHLPSKPSLVDKGILVDTSQLNRKVEYDPETHEVSFGPAVRVYEAWKATDALGRFFPFGHAPDVALGGFCLAGGQGLFMRGWGATITEWIVKLEVIVPDGRVLLVSRDEHSDIFWAARGGGQAFFGVVTKIWSRTIPKRQLFSRSFTFNVGDDFEELLMFAFDRNQATPKMFTETAVCIMRPELLDTSAEEILSTSSPLLLSINVLAYSNCLDDAENLLSAWNSVPADLQKAIIEVQPTNHTAWDDFFHLQRQINPDNPKQKWGIHSILNDPSVSVSELIRAIKPAMCDLPTKSSFGCIYMCDTLTPDENDAVFSLPQQYYISTFSGWKDSALVPKVRDTMRRTYGKASTVACGMYIADFDQSSGSLHSPKIRVWTDSARERFAKIRQRWDPDGLFQGYRAFEPENHAIT
ncbi:FAD-linked oxidoreductase azaL [Colletotrichum tropicale]|nr:FAD-linked oxidoreductase azaL [Colletotrichum tropicale]